MSGVTFVRYSPYKNPNPSVTEQLISCYREVFADEPWNEWRKCPTCERSWGIKDKELLHLGRCLSCDTPLVEFWPVKKVTEDTLREIKHDSSAWLAMDGDKVVGFCWGFPATKSAIESHLTLSLPGNKVGYSGLDVVAYQDEVGVLSGYRGQKLAKKMVALRHQDFLAKGLKLGVTRTRQFPIPSVTFDWYIKLGYEIIARYPGDDGRVVLARPLEGLGELLVA